MGRTITATLTDGDNLEVLEFLWESSADVQPRQWRRIPSTETSQYVPQLHDAGRILRAIVRYTDVGGAKEDIMEAAAAVGGNRVPVFDAAAHGTRILAENSPPATAVGMPIEATDTAGDVLTYSLHGTDAMAFAIDAGTGQLRTAANVHHDFEANESYAVTVTATDRSAATAAIAVTITLTDVIENGTIGNLAAPQVGRELVPVLADPDAGSTALGNQRWQWQIAAGRDGPWRDLPDGRYPNYVPQTSQVGQFLRVRSSYDSPGAAPLREVAQWTATAGVTAAAESIHVPAAQTMSLREGDRGDWAAPLALGSLGIRTTGTRGRLQREIVAGNTRKFMLDGNTLTYIGGVEDFETLAPPAYVLRIRARQGHLTAYGEVTVTVTNVAEPGAVTIDVPTAPQPGRALTAMLTDPDGVVGNVQWQWQERALADADWRNMDGAEYPSFVPTAAHAATAHNRLRVRARYMDAQSDTEWVVFSEPTGPLQSAMDATIRGVASPVRVRLPERVQYDSTRQQHLLQSFQPQSPAGVTPRPATDYSYRIVAGNGAGKFRMDDAGTLYYVGYGEDYEALARTGDTEFRLQVEVALAPELYRATVFVEVGNEDDPGILVMDPANPVVGATITARVSDPDALDGELRNLRWGWGRLENTVPGGTLRTVDGFLNHVYVPTAADLGRRIVVFATYHDGPDGPPRRLETTAAVPVAAAPATANQPPTFPDATHPIPAGDPHAPATVHYSVPVGTLLENASGAETPIVLVTVMATDPDPADTTIRYRLADTTPEIFEMAADSGALRYVGAGEDFETQASYLLTVIASDQHADPQRGSGYASVFVPVGNVDEPERIQLTLTRANGRPPPTPEVGTPIAASLQGGDEVYRDSFRGVAWQWQRSTAATAPDWPDIAGATDADYTPVPADAHQFLRVRARYHDVPNWDATNPTESRQEVTATIAGAVHAPVPLRITELAVVSPATPSHTYIEGDDIIVRVTFNQPVGLTGTLGISLELDGSGTRVASQTDDGTAPATTAFELRYEVALGDLDHDGFQLPANSLALSAGGTALGPRGQDASLAHAPVTTATPVRALPVNFPDINRNGRLETDDTLIMVYATEYRHALGDGTDREPRGVAALRDALIGPHLADGVPRTDANIQQLLRTVHYLFDHGVDAGPDVNQDGVVDPVDAIVMYYVLAFPELLTNTIPRGGGLANIQLRLLGNYVSAERERNLRNVRNMIARVQQLQR